MNNIYGLYGNYRQRKFTEIFESAEDFLEEYKESPYYDLYNIEALKVSDDNIKVI